MTEHEVKKTCENAKGLLGDSTPALPSSLVLKWPTGTITIDSDIIANSGVFSEMLQFDPDCKEIDMLSLHFEIGSSEINNLPKMASFVFHLQSELRKELFQTDDLSSFFLLKQRVSNKPAGKNHQQTTNAPPLLDGEELMKLLRMPNICQILTVMTTSPGLLRMGCDFARLLLLEPVYTILNDWLARTLCGLHFSTIEQWLGPYGTQNTFLSLNQNQKNNQDEGQSIINETKLNQAIQNGKNYLVRHPISTKVPSIARKKKEESKEKEKKEEKENKEKEKKEEKGKKATVSYKSLPIYS
jgi:hypothetical protein